MDLKTLDNTPPWEWPGDADKTLLAFLRDNQGDLSERLLAAELAGDYTVINDELVEALLAILRRNDEPERLRKRAAISLGPALEGAYIDGFDDLFDDTISEDTFNTIQKTLRRLYMDADLTKDIRRRILEASVRAPQDWHQNAIRAAYASDDESWRLTSVFCMQYVRGFNDQILEALKNENPDIHYEAVCAAGNWELDAAWSHISGLFAKADTDKLLLLAAIEAVASIRPKEAADILLGLIESSDQDVVDAAYEAMAMAEGLAALAQDLDDDDSPF